MATGIDRMTNQVVKAWSLTRYCSVLRRTAIRLHRRILLRIILGAWRSCAFFWYEQQLLTYYLLLGRNQTFVYLLHGGGGGTNLSIGQSKSISHRGFELFWASPLSLLCRDVLVTDPQKSSSGQRRWKSRPLYFPARRKSTLNRSESSAIFFTAFEGYLLSIWEREC